jgi:hypothetical protein
MKYQNKTVIASKKNSNAVRVFIPEKLRINGVRYVQPYKFMRISVSGQRMMVTMRDSACFFVSILSNEVVITAPFSLNLLRSYLNQVVSVIGKSATGVFRVLRKPKEGYVPLPREQKPDGSQDVPVFLEPNPDPLDQGDEAYYRGQAKIDFE